MLHVLFYELWSEDSFFRVFKLIWFRFLFRRWRFTFLFFWFLRFLFRLWRWRRRRTIVTFALFCYFFLSLHSFNSIITLVSLQFLKLFFKFFYLSIFLLNLGFKFVFIRGMLGLKRLWTILECRYQFTSILHLLISSLFNQLSFLLRGQYRFMLLR